MFLGHCAVLIDTYHGDTEGRTLTVRDNENTALISNYNDAISRVQLFIGCKIQMFDDTNYGGQNINLTAIGTGDITNMENYHFKNSDFNNKLSSYKCSCNGE